MSHPNALPSTNAAWRGGIGIAFGSPARRIPDVMELGYEIGWGTEDPPAEVGATLGVAIYRYWNGIVEVMLKDPLGRYDFSALADRDQAATLAFDAWAEAELGVKGLSRYAHVRYRPEGVYGDVMGTMDYAAANPLVDAITSSYLNWFRRHGVDSGGIALDNAGGLPLPFVMGLRHRLATQGLSLATNGCPDALLSWVDLFGEEGFPFPVERARAARAKGFRGVFAEYTMQHLSGGEIEAYLRAKLFNRIVFFGYTNGGTAAGAGHSFYALRPDVYNHHRWVFRKYVALSRAVIEAGEQTAPQAYLVSAKAPPAHAPAGARPGNRADGAVCEWNRKCDVRDMLARGAAEAAVTQYGEGGEKGFYLYVSSSSAEDVRCDTGGLNGSAVVFDEFGERILECREDGGGLRFRTAGGPALVQVGHREGIVRNILARLLTLFDVQARQRALDAKGNPVRPLKPWAPFCGGYELDLRACRSGGASLRVRGGTESPFQGKFTYFSRQGAAQFVTLDQRRPAPLTFTVWSACRHVPRSDPVTLDSWESRDRHFSARESHTYGLSLYLDYQDGEWPEAHTAAFAAGTHDWEMGQVAAVPTRPVKTALALIEFHQPAGDAWFDDAALVEGGQGDGPNLLVFPGFERDDPLVAKAERMTAEYDGRIAALVEDLRRTGHTPSLAGVSALATEVRAMQSWLEESGLTRFWAYESRDLDDAAAKLRLCATILGEGPAQRYDQEFHEKPRVTSAP